MTIRRMRVKRGIAKDNAASYWSRGNSTRELRHISQLKAEVLTVSATIAAGTGSSDRPSWGNAKYTSKVSVTVGHDRTMLTYEYTKRSSTGTFAQRINARASPSGTPSTILTSDSEIVASAPCVMLQ